MGPHGSFGGDVIVVVVGKGGTEILQEWLSLGDQIESAAHGGLESRDVGGMVHTPGGFGPAACELDVNSAGGLALVVKALKPKERKEKGDMRKLL